MIIRKGLGLIALLFSMSLAFADISLDAAKQQGLVGEDAGGYLAAVTASPSKDVRDLIRNVNDKRHDEYQRIAAKNGIDISAVEQLAGKKAIEKTQPGLYVRLPDSGWQRK
ncbi:MAG: YdbL family protein [Pseudomonadales bacterium]|nr:YdbL family protein [Pseudomonadales bacterium]